MPRRATAPPCPAAARRGSVHRQARARSSILATCCCPPCCRRPPCTPPPQSRDWSERTRQAARRKGPATPLPTRLIGLSYADVSWILGKGPRRLLRAAPPTHDSIEPTVIEPAV